MLGFQHGLLDSRHSRHLYVITLPIENMNMSRDDIVLELRERKVGASIHYPPLHGIPLYAKYANTGLPNTESIGQRLMTLPISVSMTLHDADYVVSHLIDLLNKARRQQ